MARWTRTWDVDTLRQMISSKPSGGAGRSASSVTWVLLLGFLALLGCGAVLVNTRAGPTISHDGAVYVSVARNVAGGRGLAVAFTNRSDRYSPAEAARHYGDIPLKHFPPAYPAVLAVGGLAGADVVSWSRVLNATLFGVNLALVGLLALRITGRRLWPVAIAVVLLLLVGTGSGSTLDRLFPWYYLHSAVLSEPLFLTFTFAGLLVLSDFLRAPSRRALSMLVLLCAFATLTRYVGIALAATALIAIVLFSRQRIRARIGSAIAVGMAGIVPAAMFAVIQGRASGVPDATFGYHPPFDSLRTVRNIIAAFFGFDRSGVVATLVVMGVVVAVVVVAFESARSRSRCAHPDPLDGRTDWCVVAIFAIVYIITVWVTATFLAASIPLDGRLLAPFRAALYLLVFAGLALLAREHLGQRLKLAVGVVVLLAMLITLPAAVAAGQVIFGRHTRSTLDQDRFALRGLPPGTFIATNAPENLYLATNRPSIIVPLQYTPVAGQRNGAFVAQVKQLGDLLRAKHGVLAMWPAAALSVRVPTPAQLSKIIPLRVRRTTAGIEILEVDTHK